MTDPPLATTALFPDDASDYGDFGEDADELAIFDDLLAQLTSGRAGPATEPTTVTDTNDIEDYDLPRRLLLPVQNQLHRLPHLQVEQDHHDTSIPEVLHHTEVTSDKNRRRPSDEKKPLLASATTAAAAANAPPDTRSPLERFRKPPHKALSVSDLISPAWCELQYFYVLSKHGRRKRTSAMKAGSAVHKELEDKIHVTVPIETSTKEDGFGLRIWNICQGLQTLQEIGQTRELEVWGVIGGEVVNGVIDEVSYTCPTPERGGMSDDGAGRALSEMPEYQTSITEYLLHQPTGTVAAQESPDRDEDERPDDRQIYITDVKTRVTPTLPTGSSIRPTILQLHLYHHMLENMAQNNLPLSRLAERYGLDVEQPFSDSFLAQLGQLNQEVLINEQPQSQPGDPLSTHDALDLILRHNNLASLWGYMEALFRQVFLPKQANTNTNTNTLNSQPQPQLELELSSQLSTSDLPAPTTNPTRLSPLLTATYMTSTYNHHRTRSSTPRRILGHKSFTFSPALLNHYLTDTLTWWRGTRGARGVDPAEAWKCRSCDFRGDCEWIAEKDQEVFDKAMARRRLRGDAGAGVDGSGDEYGRGKEDRELERSKSVV